MKCRFDSIAIDTGEQHNRFCNLYRLLDQKREWLVERIPDNINRDRLGGPTGNSGRRNMSQLTSSLRTSHVQLLIYPEYLLCIWHYSGPWGYREIRHSLCLQGTHSLTRRRNIVQPPSSRSSDGLLCRVQWGYKGGGANASRGKKMTEGR